MSLACPRCGKPGFVALVDGRDYRGPMFLCSDRECKPTPEPKEASVPKFSLAAQIEEVEREIALREKVYPHQVHSGKMRQSISDMHLDRMRAVLRTLTWLRDNEAKIKEKLGDAA